MTSKRKISGLQLADDLVAEGKTTFTFEEARKFLDKSSTATANTLNRMVSTGLIDRVRHGRYAIRQLGVLGTPAAAEDVTLAVGAAFAGTPHRIAYRTALDEHDVITHPSRIIQVASSSRVRASLLSSRPLQVIWESPNSVGVGAVEAGPSQVSDLERTILDAANRPDLVGGVTVLAEALVSAGCNLDIVKLAGYAKFLDRGRAIRRIGSISDTMGIAGLSRKLRPLKPISSDLNLERGSTASCAWRDSRWRVRWPWTPDEILSVIAQ